MAKNKVRNFKALKQTFEAFPKTFSRKWGGETLPKLLSIF